MADQLTNKKILMNMNQTPIGRDERLSLKQKLNLVFDDNLHTKVWQNAVDWFIISLIIISTVEVFLSTFEGVSARIGGLLNVADMVTTAIFTIEVTLRIWCADLLDPKYKGFMGRVRYCLSFYGFIDFISTYSFYLALIFPIPYVALKVLRVLRLFRVFRYMKSFRILGEAVASKKQELGISMAFLSILTVILSFLLFFAEHAAQPDRFENGWGSLVWAFAKYLGDPGKVADFELVTAWGNIIAIIVGILGIAIFAVPAGLIGSGFVEVIEGRRAEEEVKNNIERVRHAFRWEKDQQYTGLIYVPPFKPLDTIMTKQLISTQDIIDAVKGSDCFHLYNLAKAFNAEDEPVDRIVVVNYYRNRPYGCCIDRGSKVTIVSTSGYDEPITSWVAFNLALLGGFNYVGKEVSADIDNPVSYYNIENEDDCPNMRMFLDDIDRLSSQPGSWVIPMCFCIGPKSREHKIHLCYGPTKHNASYDIPNVIFKDAAAFDGMAAEFSQTMEQEYGLKVDKNEYFAITPKKNLLFHLKAENGFALRMECYTIYFNKQKIAIIKSMADILRRHLDPGTECQIPQQMRVRPKECFGFADYFSETCQ